MRFSRKGSKMVPTCSKLVPTGSKMENSPNWQLTSYVHDELLCEYEENESRNEKYIMFEI